MVDSVNSSNGGNYETYLESWNPNYMQALEHMNITPKTTVNISFASFNFSWGGPDYKTPIFGGMQMSAEAMKGVISYIHSKGGKVKMSLGGANKDYYISEAMQPMNPKGISVGNMANFIAVAMKDYGLDRIDLDLEDPSGDTAYNQSFAQSVSSMISQIKGADPDKDISLTVKGQDWNGYTQQLIKDSLPNISSVNFMEYDLWNAPGASYVDQIKSDLALYTGDPSTKYEGGHKGWGIPKDKIQIGLMPGKDDNGNTLTVADAQAIASLAQSQGYNGIMTWDLTRDYDGTGADGDGAASMSYTNAIESALGITEDANFQIDKMQARKRPS